MSCGCPGTWCVRVRVRVRVRCACACAVGVCVCVCVTCACRCVCVCVRVRASKPALIVFVCGGNCAPATVYIYITTCDDTVSNNTSLSYISLLHSLLYVLTLTPSHPHTEV